jgi:hypothetical protein
MERAPFACVPMFDLRRIGLWLAVLLVPGGILLLPLLIADLRRRRASNETRENPETPSEGPVPRLAA